MRKNNQGFSLVELIAAMAILMVVAAAMIGFFSFCLNHYRRSNEELNLQYESQLALNRLKEQVLQTSKAIGVSDDEKTLYLYDENRKTAYLLDSENKNQLLYREYEKQPGGVWTQQGSDQCFASYVTDWSVKILDADGNEMNSLSEEGRKPAKVIIWVKMEVGERQFDAEERMILRSEIDYQKVN